MVNVYTKKGIAYIMRTFIFNEMSRLQYNLSIGCSTKWRKYGIIIGKLRMFIFVAMEMEMLYRAVATTSKIDVTNTSVWQRNVSGMAKTSECHLSEVYYKLEPKAKERCLEKIAYIRSEDPHTLRKADFPSI